MAHSIVPTSATAQSKDKLFRLANENKATPDADTTIIDSVCLINNKLCKTVSPRFARDDVIASLKGAAIQCYSSVTIIMKILVMSLSFANADCSSKLERKY